VAQRTRRRKNLRDTTPSQKLLLRGPVLWFPYCVLIVDRRGSTNRRAANTSCVSTASGSSFRTGSRSPGVDGFKADRVARQRIPVLNRQTEDLRLPSIVGIVLCCFPNGANLFDTTAGLCQPYRGRQAAPSTSSKSETLARLLLVFIVFALPVRAAANLQDFLNGLMQNQKGNVLVSDPRTGCLLAVWNSREAFGAAYPPGSTAKLFTATAAMQEGLVSPSEEIFCRRVPELLGEPFHCSHPAADGPYNLASALANSCNYFFVRLSLRISAAQLAHWFAAFGLGSPPGQVRIEADDAGKARAALGEEGATLSSAQLLLAYSAFANRGQAYRLVRGSPHGRPRAATKAAPTDPALIVRLRPETLEVLSAGLEGCVRFGTCQASAVEGIRIAGKTGTAAARDSSGVTHAWFVGYAPVNKPEIALVVFLERGTGRHDAASLAGRIFKFYFGHSSESRVIPAKLVLGERGGAGIQLVGP